MPARRRRAQAPALALRLGPFTVPLSRPPPPAPPLDDGGAVAALPPAPGPAPSALEQLRQVLAQREPRLAHRLATTGEALDDGCLRRWLAARGGVEAAAAGILAHAAWREALVGASSSGVTEASIADELAARKVCLQGLDSGGCPVVVVQAARWVLRAGCSRGRS